VVRDNSTLTVLERFITVVQEEDDIIPAAPGGIVPYLYGDDRPVSGQGVHTAAQDLGFGRFGIDLDKVRCEREDGTVLVQGNTLDLIRPLQRQITFPD
jgi:hypothetical protein